MDQNDDQDQFIEMQQQAAEESRLPFVPPYSEIAPNPEGFYFHWRKLQYAFSLPNPAHFPALREPLSPRDSEAVQRYIHSCRELATYSLLNHGGGVTFNWTPDETSVVVDSPPKEALRGFAVLFRQIHSDQTEPASYKVVRSILSKASASSQDGARDERLGIIKKWSRSRAQLLQTSLSDIVQSKLHEAMGAPSEAFGIKRRHTPLELISMFNYGEYIHWGDRKDEHSELFQDEFRGNLAEFNFQEVLIGLSHFYFGYAKVLESAFNGSGKQGS